MPGRRAYLHRMQTTKLQLHVAHQVADVDPRIFGGFIEHAGRCVYQGLYEPASRHADETGCRRDVLEALGRLNMTAVRYPGGNFASGYHWLDGVGPRDRRPRVLEAAWQSIEPNHFGTDEYARLCRRMGWTPMLTANLGTGTPEEARNWVEYCNSPPGTRYADMRAMNGRREPHGVKLWCLGNEMDGAWQTGHLPAEQYAILAEQAAKMMKDVDPSIELVACGSCGGGAENYLEWDRKLLKYMGDLADYLSVHRYAGNQAGDTADYLAIGVSIDRHLDEMDAACRFVQGHRHSRKRTYLCVDEWNVWYKNQESKGAGGFAPHLLEEVYNLEDALVVAQFLNSFIRHADCVKIANLAQVVNVIAPLLTDGDRMLVQSIFHVFEMFSRRRNGVSLRLAVEGPTYQGRTNGLARQVDVSAILGEGMLHVFAVNRSVTEPAELSIDLAGAAMAELDAAEIVCGSDPKAANSYETPDAVSPRAFDDVAVANGAATVKLPPLAFAAMTFRLA